MFISVALTFLLQISYTVGDWKYVRPFHRRLEYNAQSMQNGNDVTILQNLLGRFNSFLIATGLYDKQTEDALKEFQTEYGVLSNGIFDTKTAKLILDNFMSDRYKDLDNCDFLQLGYKFKLVVRVYQNRSIETIAKLYGKVNEQCIVMGSYLIRTRGGSDSDIPLNQLTTNGDTPTGLSTIDLVSPEPDPKAFGPYPVLRLIKGVKGNSAIKKVNSEDRFISDFRNGILVHTGDWKDWDETKPMPNSNGCLHVHPASMKQIVNNLHLEANVTINPNPFSVLPYPRIPQGLISIEQLD